MLERNGARHRSPSFPEWPRWRPVRWLRRLLLAIIVLPIARAGYAHEVHGREHFAEITEPCLVISNHNMHLDQSVLLLAMPGRFRRRLAIAASARDMFANRVKGFIIALLGNAFPFAKEGAGVRDSLEYVARMLEEGWHVLYFPEGRLTVNGPTRPFKSGIALLARETGVQVLPMRIDILRPGLQEGGRIPPRGRVSIHVGAPLRVDPSLDTDAATALLEHAVRDA